MVGGVSAEAVREAVVHIDGVTGKVLGKAAIRDIQTGVPMPACGIGPPPPPPPK